MTTYLTEKFEGIDENGNKINVSLDTFKGKKVVLYFYPKDNTSGCTAEACQFRDSYNRLIGKATVIGVSPDTIKSHQKFQKDHNLNFILLSDSNHKLSEAFDVWKEKSMYGRKYMGIERSTFLLDENGDISQSWRNVKIPGHIDTVLKELA